MFSLFYGLWEYAFRRAEFHILLVGLDRAGKSTLAERLKATLGAGPSLPPERIGPTVGLNIARVEAAACCLVVWDLGGAAPLRSIWDKYYAEADAVVFCVDAADSGRFDEAKEALLRLLHARDIPPGLPVLVLANKQDAPGAADAPALTKALELGGLTVAADTARCDDKRRLRVLACSGLEGRGLQEGVAWLVECMRRRGQTRAAAGGAAG